MWFYSSAGFICQITLCLLYINQLYHSALHFDEGCKNLICLKSFRRLAADIRTTRCHRWFDRPLGFCLSRRGSLFWGNAWPCMLHYRSPGYINRWLVAWARESFRLVVSCGLVCMGIVPLSCLIGSSDPTHQRIISSFIQSAASQKGGLSKTFRWGGFSSNDNPPYLSPEFSVAISSMSPVFLTHIAHIFPNQSEHTNFTT